MIAIMLMTVVLTVSCGESSTKNDKELDVNDDISKSDNDEQPDAENGDTGNTGDTGNSGDTGDTGNSGNSGNTGDTGDTGDTGNTGDSGKLWIKISAGSSHTCAIDTDSKAYCWGSNSFGQLGDGTNSDRIFPVEVDTAGVLSNKKLILISSGGNHTCVVDNENKVYCWGSNDSGQLGTGADFGWNDFSNVPIEIDNSGVLKGVAIVSISSGYDHTCAVSKVGKAYCWGDNEYGQLGDGTETDKPTPVLVNDKGVLNGKFLLQISAGGILTCTLDDEGKAYCWGGGQYGGLGDGSFEYDQKNPVPVDSSSVLKGVKLIYVGAGSYEGYAIDENGNTYCWNENTNDLPAILNDEGVFNGNKIVSMDIGGNHSCAVDVEGNVYCWGWWKGNEHGELGNGTKEASEIPVKVDDSNDLHGKKIISVTVGSSHTCAIDSLGSAYCWGNNENGQIGSRKKAEPLFSPTPRDEIYTQTILKGKKIILIDSSDTHTCVVDDKNKVYCWGTNDKGQLGDGTVETSYLPVAVIDDAFKDKKIKFISLGMQKSCVLADNNRVYCWGNIGGHYFSGNYISSNQLVPIDITGLAYTSKATSICVGDRLNAIDENGRVYAGNVIGTGDKRFVSISSYEENFYESVAIFVIDRQGTIYNWEMMYDNYTSGMCQPFCRLLLNNFSSSFFRIQNHFIHRFPLYSFS